MAQLILNAGTANNDKTGDTLRAGGLKIKANFAEIYNALATDGLNISGGNLLKTGSWSDVRNKPNFNAIATSGSFDDLSDVPNLVIQTSIPGNDIGVEGNVAGNLAYDGTNLYIAVADWDGETEIWKTIPWGGSAGSGDRLTNNGHEIVLNSDGKLEITGDRINLPTNRQLNIHTDQSANHTYTEVYQSATSWETWSENDEDGAHQAYSYLVSNLQTPGTPRVFIENRNGDNGIIYNWTFDENGKLKFPDNTLQTTAYIAPDPNTWINELRSLEENSTIVGVTSVEYDSNGDIIALIQVQGSNSAYYLTIAKFTSHGALVWQKRIAAQTPTFTTDGWGLTLDSDDGVYVVGNLVGDSYDKTFLSKFDSSGVQVWTLKYDFGAFSVSPVIDFTSDGNLALTGYFNNGNDDAFYTMKIEPVEGSILWARSLNELNTNEEAFGMGVGPTGEVVSVGYWNNDGPGKMLIVKYDTDGALVWQKYIQVDAGFECSAADCDIDSLGNIYIVGTHYQDKPGETNISSVNIIQLNSSGDFQWIRRVAGPCSDAANSIVVGPDDHLYIISQSGNNDTANFSLVAAKYEMNGILTWQRMLHNSSTWTFGGTWNNWWVGSNLDVKDGYLVFAGGLMDPFGSTPRGLLVQLPTDGTELIIGNYDYAEATLSGILSETIEQFGDPERTDADIVGSIAVTQIPVDYDISIVTPTRYNTDTVNAVTGEDIQFNNGSKIHQSANNSIAVITGSHADATAGLSTDDDTSWMWVARDGAHISTDSLGGYKLWTFGLDGNLTLPGTIINSTQALTGSGDPVYPTAIDLTKTVNTLSDNTGSNYTLADGTEGQIMYLVPRNGATNAGVYIVVNHGRVLNNSGSTTATVYTDIAFNPFGTDTSMAPNVVTMIFTDGAWQSSGGIWD